MLFAFDLYDLAMDKNVCLLHPSSSEGRLIGSLAQ
jgi:hypothetical protein